MLKVDVHPRALVGLTTLTTAMGIAVTGPVAGVAADITTGLAVGMFNGWLTTRIGIASFPTPLAIQVLILFGLKFSQHIIQPARSSSLPSPLIRNAIS